MGLNFGKILGGLGRTAAGALGGVAGDWAVGQLFGGRNRPSNAVRGALTPAPNQYAGQVAGNLQAQQQTGADFLKQYSPLLSGAVQNRANSINAGYGQDQLGRIALGNAQTGADMAYGRGRANLALSLGRRGIGAGGGTLAGGLANLEGNRAQTMAAANNQIAQNRIAADTAGQRELLQMYQGLMNQGQGMQSSANQGLLGIGQMDVARQAQGQQNTANLAELLAMLYGQQAQRPRRPSGGSVNGYDTLGLGGGGLL